jgi:hypothetical protein
VLRYACAQSGFHAPDGPLGLIGAFDVARRFFPWLVVGGTKNLANALFRVAVGAGARGLVSAEVERVERAGAGFRVRIAGGRELQARAVRSRRSRGCSWASRPRRSCALSPPAGASTRAARSRPTSGSAASRPRRPPRRRTR